MTTTTRSDRLTAGLLPRFTALALALVLAGCSLAPPAPQAAVDTPASFKEDQAVDVSTTPANWKPAQPAENLPRGQWWTAFADPRLDALEARAAQANPNLASAAARVKAARALLRGAEADRWPVVGLQAGVSRGKASAVSLGLPQGSTAAPSTAWQAGLGASYEVDLFRRVENSITAAQAQAGSAEATYRSVLLALQADVAQTYFSLRTLDAEIAVLEATVKLRNANAELIGKRFQAGDVAEVDVARSSTQLAVVQAEAEALKGQRARVEHALALLLGQAPATFTVEPLPLAEDAPVPGIPAGLPSALLERRPDVAAAQLTLQEATARVGVARAAIFPALALTADGGYASYELSDLFKWSSRTWLTSLVLSLPIIDGGRNRAAVQGAEAALEGAVQDYRQTVLAAFADVEDNLATLKAVRGQAQFTETAVASARRAAELADKRYRAGEDSYLQLIDAQRELLSIQRQAVQLRGTWANATVGLIRSLGGAWGGPATTAAATGGTPG